MMKPYLLVGTGPVASQFAGRFRYAAHLTTLGTVTLLLAACGGGGSDSSSDSAAGLQTEPLARYVVQGTSVALDVRMKPKFTPSGPLFVTASDTKGVFNSNVTVTAQAGGAFLLRLTSSDKAAAGHYMGNVELILCADEACKTHQPVAKAGLPFDLSVLDFASKWPGNNQPELKAWTGVADWGTFQGNPAHTGYVPVTLDPNAISTRWQIAGQRWDTANGTYGSNLVATFGGRLFVNSDNKLRVFEESDASLAWEYDFGWLRVPSANPPAVADGVVYISAGHQESTQLFAFDASDGSRRFRSQMASQWETILPPVVGAHGVYINSGSFGGLYAFDTAGNSLFTADLEQQSMWSPALDATAVYTYTGPLRIFDQVTGKLLKTIEDPTFDSRVVEINGSPVLGEDSVFVANYANSALAGTDVRNYLLRFRPSDGTVAWSIPGSYPRTPAYDAGVVYAVNETPLQLEARKESDGALLWSWAPPQARDTNFMGEVLLTKNLIFVSTQAAVYAVDRATRATVWSWPEPGHMSLSSNGVLYIHGQEHLTAVNVK